VYARLVGKLVLALLAVSLVASGCFGGGRYAKYQDKRAAIRAIGALLATIPQYPGARLIGRHDSATSYKVTDGFIDAEPYSSHFRYDLSTSVSGATIQRYFRRVMHARGWNCQFQHRTPGVPYGFECARRGSTVGAYIADHGLYELDVAATHRRPPIQTVTVPGD
jgi:hypothetical protein